MQRNFTAENIDYSKPVRTVPHTLKETCSKCKQVSKMKINVKGNTGVTVVTTFQGLCGNKKCEAPMTIYMKVRIN